jgi:hypothetical protein
MNKKTATIKIEPETRDRLTALGKKGETYDSEINNLIDLWTNPRTLLLSEENYHIIIEICEHYGGSTLNEMIAYLLKEHRRMDDELFVLGEEAAQHGR